MRTNDCILSLIISIFFVSTTVYAQTANFDETWKEFITNNKISNMSQLVKPNKAYDKLDYAKYLLMNTNSNFCQSDIEEAEGLMAEVQAMDARVHKAIPGFISKMEELETKMKAFDEVDVIWKDFLETREVDLDELEDIKGARTNCEKKTLAKYSYMTAYNHLCEGDVLMSKSIFETRTLRLAEKTSLRVKDVEGLAKEVRDMKSLFRNMSKLDEAWNAYLKTGVSPGFDMELPLFPCYPIPNMKAYILQGALDLCYTGPEMLEKVKALKAKSGVALDKNLKKKIKDLETAIEKNNAGLVTLNEAWEAFIPDNKVRHVGQYGYNYCEKEPLIRAYIMDGFAYTCELAEEMLQKIDALQRAEVTPLEEITMRKINELADLNDQYQLNAVIVEEVWNKFVAQGDTLYESYESTDYYCDNIHHVKDWVLKGLTGTCEDGIFYMEEIDAFQETLEFNFTKDLECRVQNLRIKVWDCRHQALLKLARISAPDAYETRLEELMEEKGMGARPEICSSNE